MIQDAPTHAMRMARISVRAAEIFGDEPKVVRGLAKAKVCFSGRTPLELLQTESGAYLVEELLLQLDHGFAA